MIDQLHPAPASFGQKRRSFIPATVRVAVLFLLALALSVSGLAQLTTADILGTVTDSTGAIIPNAKVVLTNTGTQEKRTTLSNSSGDYSFTLLQPGHYSVTVQATGFKASTTSNVAVEAGDRARTDAHMELGSADQTVTVEAQTPLLQADNATVSSTVTEKAVQDLPLNGRNFVQLVQLVPGANEGPGNGLTSGGRPDDRRQSSGFSVNGQDDTLNNYVIDGIDDNERIINTIGVKPSVEGIQEISVETNSYAPEAGRTAGGVVTIVTKSGTNNLHGTAYEYFRNDIFDARNVFSVPPVPKAELRQNQFGASIGGPIFKDRTFFFGDYEGLRQVSGGTTYTSTVPTLAEYNNIHSINGGSPQALVNQGAGTANLPIDPVALNYLMLFPAPNTAGTNSGNNNNYVTNPSKTQTSDIFDIRIDHRFSPNNLFFARYSYNKVDTFTPAALPMAANGIYAGGGRYNFSGPSTDGAQQYSLNFTHIFTANLLVDLKAAYTRINNMSLPLNYGINADTQFGFGPTMNFNQVTSGLTPISINGFPDLGDGAYVPLQDIDNNFQYLGTVSYTKGNHNIKFGGSLIRRQARNVQSAAALGSYNFGLGSDATQYAPGGVPIASYSSAQALTNALASTLVGAFTNQNRSYDLFNPDYRTWEPSGFAQDNWKVSQRLTLVYGLRYDVFTPFTEAHNRISNFDYNQALASTPSNVASALKVAGVNGVSATAGISTVYSDVAPRVGFSMTLVPGTVLRGGYGLSFFPNNYGSNADLKNAPFVSVYAPNCHSNIANQILNAQNAPQSNALCSAASGQPATLDAGLPLPAAQTINSPSLSFQSEDPNLKPSMMQQFNLQIEQQFGANVFTIGYVGNIGEHLPEPVEDYNVPLPSQVYAGLAAQAAAGQTLNPATAALRPTASVLPNLGLVANMMSEGISNYNALQTSFQRRFSKGLAFDANYTWGHALSDVVGLSEEGDQGWANADPRHIRQYEYGNGENDIRNRFAISLNYELPFGKEFTGMKKVALGGWQTNVIGVWQSGKPFTVVNSGSGPGGYGNRANPAYNGGGDRPNQIHSANLAHKTLTEYFDTTAFVPQPLGTVGDEARNQLYGPHFRHLDLSLFKNFPVTERINLQFRAESFNISNTPSYFIANTNSANQSYGSGSFGSITQADPNYTPRQVQFALRVQF